MMPEAISREDRESIQAMKQAAMSDESIALTMGCGVDEVRLVLGVRPPASKSSVSRPSALGGRGQAVSRFASAPIEVARSGGIAAEHPAAVDGRSIFPKSVMTTWDSPRFLVSGHNNPKLGKQVLKGPRTGWPIYAVTLEERATCPRSCPVWLDCYGNAMPYARRHRPDEDFLPAMKAEVVTVARQHPEGLLVRLHALGDFYSVAYVRMWAQLLDHIPQLHVFGYTARSETEDDAESQAIAKAIRELADGSWDRFAIRFSRVEPGPQHSIVVDADPQLPDVIVCPAQLEATTACATCGLCWAGAARDKTVAFLRHGMKRGRGRRAVEAASRQPPAASRQPPRAVPMTGADVNAQSGAEAEVLARAKLQHGWTEDRVAAIQILARRGLSRSQIAKEIRGVTRNAVIAKLDRLRGRAERAGVGTEGIEPQAPSAPRKHQPKASVSRTPRPTVPPRLAIAGHGQVFEKAGNERPPIMPAREIKESPGLATVLTIRDGFCRWPIGDPSAADFTFCGKGLAGAAGPYCQHHRSIAYQGAPPVKGALRASRTIGGKPLNGWGAGRRFAE